jgi:uncharacterized protein YcbX
MIEIAGLHIYPLKGGRGISLERMALDSIGPLEDRRWMMVDPDGSLVTQREIAQLCQIVAQPLEGGLRLEGPGRAAIEVPFPRQDRGRLTVRVWNDLVPAVDAGEPAAQWCSAQLGAPLRLVRLAHGANRRTDPSYDPIGGQVSFADGYPILLAGEASLADLNARLPIPLPMNRFRPNIVVRGSGPFAEDGWTRFGVNGIPFDAVKPCARCVVTTTDQQTGERGVEPLRTMARFRKRAAGVMFGVNVVHRGVGEVRVGDEIIRE